MITLENSGQAKEGTPLASLEIGQVGIDIHGNLIFRIAEYEREIFGINLTKGTIIDSPDYSIVEIIEKGRLLEVT